MDTPSPDGTFSHGSVLQDSYDVPLPHLASVAFFRSPRRETLSPPCPRPVPPTPRKMLANNKTSPTRLPRQRRPPSASSIPRPISGTSRQITPLTQFSPTTASASRLQPVNKMRKTPESSFTRERKLSGSLLLQRAIPPRVDSLLYRRQRTSASDLSGRRQQLHLRNYSTHSLAGLDAIAPLKTTSAASTLSSPLKGLSKSKTSTSFLSSAQDLTPQRHLMQPLGPPLPRTQTMGNISCFGGDVDLVPSPSKPSSLRPFKARTEGRENVQVGVVEALRESRMTDEEIDLYSMVEREKQANRTRFRYSSGDRILPSGPRQQLPKSSSSFLRKSSTSASINLSINDTANLERLEDQQQRKISSGLISRRRLFINSTLANQVSSGSAILTPNSTISTESGPDEEWEVNLKHVQFSESIPYWTGRYVAVLDRLRNQELTARLSNADPHTSDHRLISSPSVEDTIYDLTQRKRMNLALDELRSCCRTEKALKSFERFETQLRKRREKDKTTKRSLVGDDRSISGSDEHSVHKSNKNFASMKSKFWWPTVSEPAVLTGNADSRKVSQRKSDYDSQLLMSRRPGLAKSHTTGDLAQMGASGGKARDLPKSSHHLRRPSISANLSQVSSQAWKDREERAARRAQLARRRTDTSNISESSSTAIGKTSATNTNRATLQASAQTTQAPPEGPEQLRVQPRKVRRSSADKLKDILDTGLSGIRRISRRVAGGGVGSGSIEGDVL